jgi:2-dehydrotetronate isomerase
MKFHANTGFLFPDLPFTERLRAAAAAGFDGVECHDEIQRHDAHAIADLLAETGLEMGGLNTRMGASAGCAALRDQEAAFAADMQAAHAAAEIVGARAIHVLAGRGETCRATYLANLRRALDLTDRLILIEPLCRAAMADYHLSTLSDALDVTGQIGHDRIRAMFDWYHITMAEGAGAAQSALTSHRAQLGHVQAASFPARAEPDAAMITATKAAGFDVIGLEYRPTMPERDALAALRSSRLSPCP